MPARSLPADASPFLLERDAELAELDALVADAAAGSGRLVLIEGPAGIGKSGLLASLRERAQPTLQVLQARAGELEREFAYGVVRQLFEARVAARGGLSGAAAPAAALFEQALAPDQEGAASFAALHGLYWLTLDLAAEQPLLLAIDDLHWTDRPSLRFLAYLARRLDGAPVLVAATLRSAEPGTDPGLLAEIVQDPVTHPLRPGPLSAEAVAALVRERLGDDADPGFCAACHEATGGNPLLLRQLLRALEAEGVQPSADQAAVVRAVGPRAVSSTVLLRLSRLSEDARAVARATAVLGESAELPRVAALAGRDERAVAAASGELIRAEIIRPEPPLGFVHPLVRDAVYHELPPPERELEHERAAEMLREAGAAIEQVAAQLLLAPRRGAAWAAELLQQAGSDAVRRGATESAVAYLRRALEEPPAPEQRIQVLLALGIAEALTSGPAAAEHLQEAYDAVSDPQVRADVAAVLSRVRLFTGDADGAARIAHEAAAAVAPVAPDAARALEAVELMTFFFGGGGENALGRMAALRHLPDAPGPGAKALAGVATFDWMNRGGHVDECVALSLAALEGEELPEMDSTLLSIPTVLPLVLGDRPEALEHVRRLQEFGHRRGSLLDVSSLQLWLGYTQQRLGDLEAAEELLRRANEGFAVYGLGSGPRAFSDAFLTEVLVDRGDVAGARTVLTGNRDQGDASNSARFYVHARMRLLAAEGRWEDVHGRDRGVRDPLPALPRGARRAVAGAARGRAGPPRADGRGDRRRDGGARRRAGLGRPRHGGPRADAARPAGARRGDRAPRGGRRPAGRHDREARARPRAVRARRRDPPRPAPGGRPRPAAARAGARHGLRAPRRWPRPPAPSSTRRAHARAPRRSPASTR